LNRESVIGWLAAFLIRALGLTLRFRVNDLSGICDGTTQCPVIWAFWHNRMLVVPVLQERFFKNRHGSVLTSPSKDGEIIAEIMGRFGQNNVRGSSSRRGATAMRELAEVIEKGGDVAITPDGPRGPRYKLGPGIILLAQKTGAPVVPVHVEYSRCLRAGRWDGFMIPLPFARVEVTLGELYYVRETPAKAEFEGERLRLEQTLTDAMCLC
jgi:lysophospholipid acyltransferase (LPLAT)-like uncharacterized protein